MEQQRSDMGVPLFEQPNLLFGNDVYFPPTSYLDKLRLRVTEQHNVQMLALAGKPWDESYGPREEWEAQMEVAPENTTQYKYFEARFRSRNLPDTIIEDYFEFNSKYYREGAEIAPEAAAGEFPILDKFMGEQAWATTFYAARRLHQLLPEGSAEKDKAKTYAAFSGGIIAQEFCQMALAYADERLAQEYVPRLKHLLTICWPVIDALHEFAPEEAAIKMQLLREILLEQLAQVGDEYNIDFNITTMARSFSMTDEETLTKFYVMDADEPTKQRVRERMELHIQRLNADHRYDAAINVLYKTAIATGMDLESIQPRLDELAELGYGELSLHFSHIDEYDHDNRHHNRAILVDNEHLGPATAQKLKRMYNSRNLEVMLGKFNSTGDPETAQDLLQALSMADPTETRSLAERHIICFL